MFIYAIIFFVTTLLSSFDIEKFIKKRKFISSISLNKKENYIPISILVPAYNEDVTIINSIKSLLSLDYPEYEIVIINDGSVDKTEEYVKKEFNLQRIVTPIRKQVECQDVISIYENTINNVRVVLVNKVNGGKADALNMGINVSRFPLFISLDADSVLQKNSLLKIVEPFIEDDKTIAVGGSIKVANGLTIKDGKIIKESTPKKLIVLFQMVEYIRVFIASRVAFNKFNLNMIISGAFGMFNKSLVISCGGYNSKTVGEDMELVVKMHTYCLKNKKEYKISYVPDAICLSQVPEKYSDLKKQRRRWHMGLIQSIWKHKYIFLNPKYGALSFISYIYYLIFEVISPFIEIFGLISIGCAYFMGVMNLKFMLIYLFVFIFYNVIVSYVALTLNDFLFDYSTPRKTRLTLYLVSIIEGMGFRQLCSIYRLSAFINYKKNRYQWGKITRVSMGEDENIYENKEVI